MSTDVNDEPKRRSIDRDYPLPQSMQEAKNMALDICRTHFLKSPCIIHFIQVTQDRYWKRKPAEAKCEEVFRIKVLHDNASQLTRRRRTAPCSNFGSVDEESVRELRRT